MASKTTVMMFFNLAKASLPEVLAGLRHLQESILAEHCTRDRETVSGVGTLGSIVTEALMLVDELAREVNNAAASIPIRTPIQSE